MTISTQRTPERVYVFENLATVLAMPDTSGAIAVHGGGHRANLVARLPWVQRVTYRGDLDSHGFAILHQLRANGVEATSVLMDTDTLLAHKDLCGNDPEPNIGFLFKVSRGLNWRVNNEENWFASPLQSVFVFFVWVAMLVA